MSAVLIVDSLIGCGVCIDCIAQKTQLTIEAVIETLVSIRHTFKIRDIRSACEKCLSRAVIHRLG